MAACHKEEVQLEGKDHGHLRETQRWAWSLRAQELELRSDGEAEGWLWEALIIRGRWAWQKSPEYITKKQQKGMTKMRMAATRYTKPNFMFPKCANGASAMQKLETNG